jgi:hypothetical protein
MNRDPLTPEGFDITVAATQSEKPCIKCGDIKMLDQFGRRRSRAAYWVYKGECKGCEKARVDAWYRDNQQHKITASIAINDAKRKSPDKPKRIKRIKGWYREEPTKSMLYGTEKIALVAAEFGIPVKTAQAYRNIVRTESKSKSKACLSAVASP